MPAETRPRRRPALIAAAATFILAAAVGAAVQPASAMLDGVGIAAASAGCGKAPTLTSGNRTIQSGGQSRSFILKIPDVYNNTKPHRLAFGFHWLGGTSDQVAGGGSDGFAWAYYGMLSQDTDHTTIFVAPQGIRNGWANSGGRDVTFTDDMIRVIQNDLCVDTSQLFSVGFSYGGAMSYALACARPGVFRAVAAIAAPGAISGCSGGTQPVAYMGIHGINDNIQSGRSLRDTFVRNNGCTPQNAPEPGQGSLTHIITVYSGCQAGYPVVWAPFDGGHQQGPVDGCAGCESGARSWVKPEVWRFFTQFGGTPPTSTPTSSPPTTFRLRGQASSRCLDVSGASSANGAQLVIWDCHTNANQRFTRNGQTLQVMGKCLDMPGNAAAGTRVQIWDCHGGANQQWNLNSNGTISNAQNGLCLDVNGAATANGSAVIVWNCHTGANQIWARA
jgi:poly(3-hydroxybutyrate) depolymerase